VVVYKQERESEEEPSLEKMAGEAPAAMASEQCTDLAGNRTRRRRRLAFVVNPMAGDGKGARAWVTMERILGQECEDAWAVFFTERLGHGIELTQTAIKRGYNVVVSVGGDGTHNEVMNGILGVTRAGVEDAEKRKEEEEEEEERVRNSGEENSCEVDDGCEVEESSQTRNVSDDGLEREKRERVAKENVVMGIVPVGTGGDLQRTFGTRDYSVRQHLELILRPEEHNAAVQWVDIGKVTATPLSPEQCTEHSDETTSIDESAVPERGGDIAEGEPNSRFYINISSCGISGAICHGVNNSSKALGGFVTFLFHTAMRTILWKCKPVRWKLDNELDWRTVNLYQLVLANGKYFGGGMCVAPQAEMNNGHMDVVAFRDVGVFDATLLPRVYTGSHMEVKKVHYSRAKTVTAEPNFPVFDDSNAKKRQEMAGQELYTVLVEADGEIVGKLPATWTVVPSALQLLMPILHTTATASDCI